MSVKPVPQPQGTFTADVDRDTATQLLKDQQALAKGSYWAAFASDSTMSLLNGIFQWQMMNIADDNADEDRTLRTTMESHAYELNTMVVTAQEQLANKIEDNKVEIARLESRERVKTAQIGEDAKTERARDKHRLLAFYPTGTPVGPRSVG